MQLSKAASKYLALPNPYRERTTRLERQVTVKDLPDKMLPIKVDMAATPLSERFLLASVVESCEDAIISKDLQGTITSWNKAACRMFGYTAEEMIGSPILRLIPEELRDEETEILRKVRAGEPIENFQTVRVKKNGERIDVSLTISPIRDDAGTIIGASKISHDISDRKRGEEARLRLAAIVESSDDAILSKNLDGIIMTWNAAASRIFGYCEEEIVGQSILRLIPEELHAEEYEILRRLRCGERIDHYETTRVTKSGERIEVSLTISPVKDNTGKVIGSSKIARDISSRKRMERSLIQAEKLAANGKMAATIAHEINNPLESVMNLIFLARKASADGSKAHGYLLTAEKEIERVSHIARRTLGYYRDPGTPTELLLHELIEEVLTVYQSNLQRKSISVERDFNDRRPVMVSRGEMIQVFSNVIANSIAAMPQGGSIQIEVKETAGSGDPSVAVAIRDEGTGIKEENLPRIFEPFFTTKGSLGTGIGLWVAKQLVENRGGKISVASSTKPGSSGTTIYVSIPFADKDGTSPRG